MMRTGIVVFLFVLLFFPLHESFSSDRPTAQFFQQVDPAADDKGGTSVSAEAYLELMKELEAMQRQQRKEEFDPAVDGD
jgi:hypothetical protein